MWSVTFLYFHPFLETWVNVGGNLPFWTMCTDKKHVIDTAVRNYPKEWGFAHAMIVERRKEGIEFVRVRQGHGKAFKALCKLNSQNHV